MRFGRTRSRLFCQRVLIDLMRNSVVAQYTYFIRCFYGNSTRVYGGTDLRSTVHRTALRTAALTRPPTSLFVPVASLCLLAPHPKLDNAATEEKLYFDETNGVALQLQYSFASVVRFYPCVSGVFVCDQRAHDEAPCEVATRTRVRVFYHTAVA